MSNPIKPEITNNLNQTFQIKFDFPIPEYTQYEYEWDYVDGTFGTNSTGGNVFITSTDIPTFPGFIVSDSTAGTHGTSAVNYLQELVNKDVTLIKTSEPIKMINQWFQITDTIIGDIDFIKVNRRFRISEDNYIWSAWKLLTVENLNQLASLKEEIWIELEYSATQINYTDFDVDIPITLPYKAGWQKLHSGSSFYQINRDYPDKSVINYTIGVGEQGDYLWNTETKRMFGPKNNGFWGSPFRVGTRQIVTDGTNSTITDISDNILTNPGSGTSFIYFPGFITEDIWNNKIQQPVNPIDDYTLTIGNDILFGDELEQHNIPKEDDFILLNPLFQSMPLTGYESLKMRIQERILPDGYYPRVYIKDISLIGEKAIFAYDDLSMVKLEYPSHQIAWQLPFKIKAFKFTDVNVISTGVTDNRTLNIYFRWSANNRNWTPWEPLTKDNITSIKPDPLRFFYMEFVFERGGTDETGLITILDVQLDGNFWVVEDEYYQLGRFGLRSDCDYRDAEIVIGEDENGNPITIPGNQNEDGNPIVADPSCVSPFQNGELIDDDCDPDSYVNFYQKDKPLALEEKLADDATQLLGFKVEYYRVDPDQLGSDPFIHEHQLYNVVDQKNIKILVPENKFHDGMFQFNNMNLSLIGSPDAWEVHITRKEFQKHFGIGFRPGQKDYLFFCETNKWYRVTHAQVNRPDFMNAAIYYKVQLDKWEDDQSVNNGVYQTPVIDAIIETNSLPSLFGEQVEEQTNQVVPDTMESTKEELTRQEIFAVVKDIQLENGPNLVAQNCYQLISREDRIAVNYSKLDTSITGGETRTVSAWFNITNIKGGKEYNIIDNYSTLESNGYKINWSDGFFEVEWYGQFFELGANLQAGKWYAVIFVFNQRQHILEWAVYQRKESGIQNTTELDIVYEGVEDLEPVTADVDAQLRLMGSDMRITNIRVYNDWIPKSNWSKELNKYYPNTENIIMMDNANRKIISPEHKF